jgi:hypothetical protein
VELDRKISSRRFESGPRNGGFAEVGSGDDVTSPRQADALRPDPAGAIQNSQARFAAGCFEQWPENGGLAGY